MDASVPVENSYIRFEIKAAQIHIRAAIRDFLLSLVGQRWQYKVVDEPGVTEFVFEDNWGKFGKIRIHEIRTGVTIFTKQTDAQISDSEMIDLVSRNEILVEESEQPVIDPILKVFFEKQELGIDRWTLDDYFRAGYENPQYQIPSNTLEEIKAVENLFQKYRERVKLRREASLNTITQSIISDLKMQGVLRETEFVTNGQADVDPVQSDPPIISYSGRVVPRKTKPAGRPTDQWNIDAWEIIQRGNEEPDAYQEAYLYWLNQQNLQNEVSKSSTKKAFASAMRRQKKKSLSR